MGGTRGEGARELEEYVVPDAGLKAYAREKSDIRGVAKQKKPATYRTHSALSAWLLFGHRIARVFAFGLASGAA